ncbi:restriction endonuclease [Vibrio vulnificus]|nr:restriction endonuclease [Vibrio vulnificus]EJL6278984.1 restriction endonuclease [Vibrio cholerae]EHH0850078.1 restriction endonuclease [Vibrio vulnificus]EHH2475121.1 restriction endonuclease [Vibrio vulnificus]EHU4930507.1 restriction endonuclease [Vibrio vulnificus]EHW0628641.1 restriction endonuclease [Vibrio vulnificus]
MASIWFKEGDFADHLHELLGYKSGVAASIEHMCDLLSGTPFADEIPKSEKFGIRIRSEDYESLYYELLHKVGTTEKVFRGHFEVFEVLRKLEKSGGMEFAYAIQEIFTRNIRLGTEAAIKSNAKVLDPSPMINEAAKKFGRKGLDGIVELIMANDAVQKYSPLSSLRFKEWENIVDLNSLFNEYQPVVENGAFFDQRFIDYLSVNNDKLQDMHWRKFEEFTAECFTRFGYNVELGPGSNDDGVDVRVWHPEKKDFPKYIIQCKRYKSKIEKLTIKGLYTDVLHEGAEIGLLVTTSEFSTGARKTIDARGYPIEEVNRDNISMWLQELRTPGTGIVRV